MSIASDIKRIVEEAYAEAGTGSSVTEIIRRRIAEYMSRQAVKGDARKDLDAEVRRSVKSYMRERDAEQAEAFGARYGTKSERQAEITKELAAEVERAQAGMQRAQSRILPFIQRAIETAARTGADPVEIARKAARRAKRADAAMQAEISTAKASIDRIMRMKSATESGYEYFRYAGPTANVRAFCSWHVGNTYHLSDIERMDNGQGLPVRSHCGGYHCRHRWAPVTPERMGVQGFHLDVANQMRAASDLPVPMNVVAMLKQPIDVVKGRGSKYKDGTITLDDTQYNGRHYKARSVVHELAHAVVERAEIIKTDYKTGQATVHPELIQAMEKMKILGKTRDEINAMTYGQRNDYAKGLLEVITPNGAKLKEWAERKKIDVETANDQARIIADTVAALTKGKLGYGHSPDYWRDDSWSAHEITAHAFEAKFLGVRYFQDTMPELYQELASWMTLIEKLASKK